MYNRYIPQPDGSFRRSRMEERKTGNPPPSAPCTEDPKPQPPPPLPPPPPVQHRRPQRPSPPQKQEGTGISGFFKRLLPKDFDTGDLIVVMLLLLMAGDNTEDQNTALLTLALYFFM